MLTQPSPSKVTIKVFHKSYILMFVIYSSTLELKSQKIRFQISLKHSKRTVYRKRAV